MSKIFEKAAADHEVHDRIRALQEKFYPDHVKVGLTCDVVLVDTDDPDAEVTTPVLKLHGVPCAAIVSITAVKNRAKGFGDIEIAIDRRRYEQMTDDERDALLDHELHHPEVRKDRKTHIPLIDALGRPKLKMKPHDHEFGWFTEVARRHGDASLEVRQAHRMMDTAGQFYWPDLFEAGAPRSKTVRLADLKRSA